MALQDILDAISAQADQQIADARSAHQKAITQLREASERSLAKKKQDMALHKEEKKRQLKAKTEAHAEAHRRNSILQTKQELLNRLFGKVTDALAALPDAEVEPLLAACLKTINLHGTLLPAKKHAALLRKIAPSEQFTMGEETSARGGFLFVSEKQEADFTFEHLVQEALRPQMELEVSRDLFVA
ncbi:hypothetical protein COU76_04125 [Candidatus Peregrinibacteria bacterium CG10_big_fil_rev_8_21_14_0_10_49_10]|nr:MAG: hypothetical protein COU76_04125 [Candidatus Peregrinibacteria bacterium CG10_big_fil_rev_8_21_14_0_10_49_10]